MAPAYQKILKFTETQKSPTTWNYANTKTFRTPGAFRAVSVADLLQRTATISLYEWKTVKFPFPSPKKASHPLDGISYVAISHVWDYGTEVNNKIRITNRPLHIDVTDPKRSYKEISWTGLVEIAHAARNRGATYIWLDFLCLDQVDRGGGDEEKALQICIMADIYRQADNVVTMIGGIGAVQSVKSTTAWMDRAWTLQEAILNRKNTYVYVKWPSSLPRNPQDSGGNTYNFITIPGELDNCLINLRDLLAMADADLSAVTPSLPKIVVLDGEVPGAGVKARHCLRAALSADRRIRDAGVWRSMWMRTSTNSVDVVYSIMGCFGLQIDPYRKNRDPEYLFHDLARKTAALSKHGPAWLNIEGVGGSLIPRNQESHIMPAFPDTASDGTPVYGKKVSADFVTALADYVKKFEVRFVTHSHPHIINAYMFTVRSFREVRKGVAKMKLRNISGTCYYKGKLNDRNWDRVQGVYIGEVGNMGFGVRAPHAGQQFFLFIKWNRGKGQWEYYGDGSFRPRGKWKMPKMNKWLFTVGEGAQDKISRWPHRGKKLLDQRTRNFRYHSYGVVPLEDFHVDSPARRPIAWFGHKYDKPPGIRWKKYKIEFDTSKFTTAGLNKTLKRPAHLHLASCHTNHPPKYVDSSTKYKLTKMGSLRILYSFGGWKKSICAALARSGVEGVMIPYDDNDPSPISRGSYFVSIKFGKQVIYVQTKPNTHTQWEFTQIYVLPYGGWGGPILNADSILPPSPPPIPSIPSFPSIPSIPSIPQPIPYQPPALGYIPDDQYNAIVRPMGYPGVTRVPVVQQPTPWPWCPPRC
ncbi:hypothetical protein AAE478_006829 [Parahypoxylon ruwenzoriense]